MSEESKGAPPAWVSPSGGEEPARGQATPNAELGVAARAAAGGGEEDDDADLHAAAWPRIQIGCPNAAGRGRVL